MALTTRSARWLWVLVVTLSSTGAGAYSAQTGAGAPVMEWTGTVTVDERAVGTYTPAPNQPGFGVNARVTSTYTLNGDGTVSWTASADSQLNMGGQYTIPTRGSGSGTGTSDVEFNGSGWEIGVEPDDDFPTTVDYTQQDYVIATKGFPWLLEIAKAMGQPVNLNQTHIEEGKQGPAPIRVPSAGAATATSLSGSLTVTIPDSSRINGFFGVPTTITATWNLRKGPVRPHVKIYGPECGCLDEDATDKTLHFIAGASPTGGEFEEFVITSDGKAPEISGNSGGARPSVDITGTKDTGAVTLKIRYTRNGVRTMSEPLTVHFCQIEEIELDGGQHDIGFDVSGKLLVDAKAKAWRDGKDVSKELEWDLEKMGDPTTLTAEPSTKKTDHIKFTYEFMPRKNADFGPKKLTASVGGNCACQRKDTIRTFFPDVDSNHPDDATPNWYYYWKQTGAAPPEARGLLTYQARVTDVNLTGVAIARYDHASGKILLSDLVFGKKACRDEVDANNHAASTGRHAEGIDCFGETIRHEMQHRTDAIDWWGSPSGPYGVSLLDWFLNDWDHDQVPNRVEEILAGCKAGTSLLGSIDAVRLTSMLSDLIAKGKTTWFTCDQVPFKDATDAEINAYWKGWTWPIGSVNADDWSCGDLSKQWKGKKCGS